MTTRVLQKVRAWLLGAGVLGCVIVYAMFIRSHWTPASKSRVERYACPDQKAVVYYPHHANTQKAETPVGMRIGSMHFDKIGWGDYEIVTVALGLQSPFNINYGDLHVMHLRDEQLNDVACHAQMLPRICR
jgi:hypothetical protein